ncbi:MAG: hypothetical protein KF819_23250 [Labilithrix sp.]|nr:hypothetical protein [Labilithrix sp.]
MKLRCTHCDGAFEGDEDARCPKCLRRTSVVEAVEQKASARRVDQPAPWPAGTACPLCLAREVGDDVFHFEIAESGPNIGGPAASTTVRCRCCAECRARVVGLQRVRKVALPFVLLGIVAWLASPIAEAPLRARLHLGFPAAFAVGTLIALIVAGVPLFFVDRAQRVMRKSLETSWLFQKVRASLPAPDGLLQHEHGKVLADVPPAAKVVDASEILSAR